jgi:hypothetical protein
MAHLIPIQYQTSIHSIHIAAQKKKIILLSRIKTHRIQACILLNNTTHPGDKASIPLCRDTWRNDTLLRLRVLLHGSRRRALGPRYQQPCMFRAGHLHCHPQLLRHRLNSIMSNSLARVFHAPLEKRNCTLSSVSKSRVRSLGVGD